MTSHSPSAPSQPKTPLLLWPLATLPVLLIVRSSAFEGPNETPKWLLIVLLGLIISLLWALKAKPRALETKTIKIPVIPALVTTFIVGILLGMIQSVNPEEAFNRGAYWFFSAVILFQVGTASRLLGDQYLKYLRFSILISSLILAAWFWYAFFVDFNDPSFNKFVRFSRIGHFNFTADVLTCLLPLTLWATLNLRSRGLQLLASPISLSLLFMSIASGSLGGMGGLLLGGVFSGCLGLLARSRSPTQHGTRGGLSRKIGAGIMLVLFALPALKLLIDQLPEDYRSQILVRAEWWDAPKTQDLSAVKNSPPLTPLWLWIAPALGARTPMWAATAGMVEAHPWIGYGTGSYLYEYLGYYKRYDLFVDPEIKGQRIKTNPHNLELQIASENGLPLTALFLALYGWLWLRVVKKVTQNPTSFWILGCWALTAAFLDAQVNHVFYNPGSLFVATLLIGTLYGNLEGGPTLSLSQLPSPRLITVSKGLFGALALSLAAQPIRWAASDHLYTEARPLLSDPSQRAHLKAQELLKDSLSWSPSNVKSLYTLASIELMEGRLKPAEELSIRFLKVAPNHTAGLNLMADIEQRLGKSDSARQHLARSLEIEPENIETVEQLRALERAFPKNP